MTALAETEAASRHKCLIYDGHASEQLPVVVPLLMDGLRTNQRCLYLGSPDLVQMVKSALDAKGLDTEGEIARGALVFSSDRGYLNDGFDPQGMVRVLTTLIDEALRDGYGGLTATGDMMWELGTEENFERLREYEALLEQVFREKPLNGICQYHRRSVPAHAVHDALLTHRSLYLGDVLSQENHFYIPPEFLLANDEERDQRGAWMCEQITRIMKAERKRDDALAALRESERQQRRLAEELAFANRDLERRVSERTADLEAVNRELEAFSYSVSHDLRAPLRHVEGFSQLLQAAHAAELGEDGRALVERICSSARHMGELIEGLLTLSRVSKEDIRRERVDISAVAGHLLQELGREQPGRQVEFKVTPQMWAFGDRSLLRAALTNLLSNAWKFTANAQHARITVGTMGDSDRRTIFFVGDNGAGFDMQYAKRLFGAFQRLHRQDEFPGTGVGLATVQRIMQRHGGRVWAEGKVGEGATFFFSLPTE